jgi:hypothetical protein
MTLDTTVPFPTPTGAYDVGADSARFQAALARFRCNYDRRPGR